MPAAMTPGSEPSSGVAGDTDERVSQRHSVATIVSMAVVASALATLLHEGLGHGVVAWLRGETPTMLTSNHLSSLRSDRVVAAGGTVVNLIVGAAALLGSRAAGGRANLHYFLWILAALNLLPGAGYFLYSGMFGFGDWYDVIKDQPHEGALRVALVLFGAALYVLVVRWLAVGVRPFAPTPSAYNVVGRYAYYAAGVFSCAAGALDPLGLKLFFVSTVAAAFGGSSGMLWMDSLMPSRAAKESLVVRPQPGWWVAAVVLGGCYIWFVGRGISLCGSASAACSGL
ncbi:MAG TPA: hypothetical protein VGD59_06140 [Acidisarcina sp.]